MGRRYDGGRPKSFANNRITARVCGRVRGALVGECARERVRPAGRSRLFRLGTVTVGLLIAGQFRWPVLGEGSRYLEPEARAPMADPLGYGQDQVVDVRSRSSCWL
jgi:hypothetical protein